MFRLFLIALLTMGFTSPAHAQLIDRITNPRVPVVIMHPPDLGLDVKRVAFGPSPGTCSNPLIDRVMEVFIRRRVEVIDHYVMQRRLIENNYYLRNSIDNQTTKELKEILGPSVLLTISSQCRFEPRMYYANRQGPDGRFYRYHVARVDGFLNLSIRVVDLESSRIFSIRTIREQKRAENAMIKGVPSFPSQEVVQNALFEDALKKIERMFFPWRETKELVFFDNKACNLRKAYKLLKTGDIQGAAALSKEIWQNCRGEGVKPKIRAHATYNLGMAYFIYGDFENALKFFVAANRIKPGNIMAETIAECRKALRLSEEMRAVVGQAELATPGVAEVHTIHDAVKGGHWNKAEAMLRENPDLINTREKHFGFTPLHLAAYEDHVEVTEKLIAHGAEVNLLSTKLKRTALHLTRDPNVAKILIDGGGDPNVRDREGKTPLHIAAESGSKELLTLLLEAGSNPSLKDKKGRNAHYYAEQNGDVAVVDLFRGNQKKAVVQ
jgi:hypothetical protein